MTTQALPLAVHVGRDDLPFVDIGGGNLLKVIRVDEAEGLWIVENVWPQNRGNVGKHICASVQLASMSSRRYLTDQAPLRISS